MLGKHKQETFTTLSFIDQETERLSGWSVLSHLEDESFSKGHVGTIERAMIWKKIGCQIPSQH